MIWEMALLPTIQLSLRYKLFAIRDHLRRVYTQNRASVSEEVFKDLHGFLNWAVDSVPDFTVSSFRNTRKALAEDDRLRKRVERTRVTIEACPLPEIADISNQIDNIVRDAFFFNSGGWFVFLIPVALTFGLMKGTKNVIKNIACIPAGERDRIMPSPC
jgi:hypothetical protein